MLRTHESKASRQVLFSFDFLQRKWSDSSSHSSLWRRTLVELFRLSLRGWESHCWRSERTWKQVKGASVQKTELTCYICYILLTSFSSSSFRSQPIPSVLDYHTTLQNINTTYIPWIHTYPTEHKDHIYPGYIYSGLVWSGKEFHFWIWS